jgi:hypothetical protein
MDIPDVLIIAAELEMLASKLNEPQVDPSPSSGLRMSNSRRSL